MTFAKVFKTGRSQAVRLPKEFRFNSKEVCIARLGGMVVMYDPKDRKKMLVESFGKASEDFLADRAQPPKAEKRRPL